MKLSFILVLSLLFNTSVFAKTGRAVAQAAANLQPALGFNHIQLNWNSPSTPSLRYNGDGVNLTPTLGSRDSNNQLKACWFQRGACVDAQSVSEGVSCYIDINFSCRHGSLRTGELLPINPNVELSHSAGTTGSTELRFRSSAAFSVIDRSGCHSVSVECNSTNAAFSGSGRPEDYKRAIDEAFGGFVQTFQQAPSVAGSRSRGLPHVQDTAGGARDRARYSPLPPETPPPAR